MGKMLLTLVLLLASIGPAFAQSTVSPRWNFSAQPVCPNGYDYVAGMNVCVAQGFAAYGHFRSWSYRAVAPRWNSRGSVVCPEGYGYVARRAACLRY